VGGQTKKKKGSGEGGVGKKRKGGGGSAVAGGKGRTGKKNSCGLDRVRPGIGRPETRGRIEKN